MALSLPALAATDLPAKLQPEKRPDLHPHEGDVVLHDYALQNGERFKDLRLHYMTLGTAQRDARGAITNAVLLLHATGGTGKTFLEPTLADNLFEPGEPLDVGRFFIVLPDGIGLGGSTQPSEGLGAHFPHYGYVDQVDTQHALLERLGITHVKLVSGISQGGMQTWLWAERYPEEADLDVPIASMPMQISGRNLMWRQIVIAAIRNDPGYRNGDYDPAHKPKEWAEVTAPMFAMMLGTPQRLQASGPDRAKTLAYDAGLTDKQDARDPNDFLYDFASSADYNPGPDLGKIRNKLVAINFADDQVNPASLPSTKETVEKIPGAHFVLLPGGYGHSTIYHAEAWRDALAQAMGH